MAPLPYPLLACVLAYNVGAAVGVRRKTSTRTLTHADQEMHRCEVRDTLGLGLVWQVGINGSARQCKQKCIKLGVYEPYCREEAFCNAFDAVKEDGLCHCRLKEDGSAVVPPFPNLAMCEKRGICWEIYQMFSGITTSSGKNVWQPSPDVCPPCGPGDCNSALISTPVGKEEVEAMIKKGTLPPGVRDIYLKPKKRAGKPTEVPTPQPTEEPTDAPTPVPTVRPTHTLSPTQTPTNPVWFEDADQEAIKEMLKRRGSVLKAAELNDQWCQGLNVGAMQPVEMAESGVGGDKSCNAKYKGGHERTCDDLFGSGTKTVTKVVVKNGRVALFGRDGCECNRVSADFPVKTRCLFSVSEM